MTFRVSSRSAALIVCAALFALAASSVFAQRPNNVSAGIQLSHDLGLADASKQINISVHMQLSDRAAFDHAVDALYDPASPSFHKWMTNADLRKYAPTEAQREAVRRELRANGLTILSTDPLGFMIRARGPIASVERAFNTEIHEFEYNGATFRANVRDARLNGEAGNYVSTVAGIESHTVRPMFKQAVNLHTGKPYPSIPLTKTARTFPEGSTIDCLSAPQSFMLMGSSMLPMATYSGTVYDANTLVCDYLPSQLQDALGLTDVYAAGYTGAGQTIVLMEGYGYPTLEHDANTFYKLAGLPALTPKNFSIIYPEGKPNPSLGILTGWNGEIALDLASSHTVAPGANILVVATSGQDNEDFQNSISYVTENGLGNTISNSYLEDTDLVAGPFEQNSWDDVLEVAAAKGISVNFSSGDGGDGGLGTPVGAAGVPAVDPYAVAVGGTSILNDVYNPGKTITTSWGDTVTALEEFGSVQDPPSLFGLIGGGGGGESIYWPKPSWQSSLPGTGRQTPDVSALADPYTGFPIVISSEGQQFVAYGIGGTSLACPIFSAFWALANEKAGSSLGQAAPLIASLPYGGVQDVLPTTDSSKYNTSGSITDSSGTTNYTALDLFGPTAYGNRNFTSTVWELDSGDYYDFGFGIDSSLTVKKGWDNATGWGTPYGLAFIDAVNAAAQQ
jgi:subtilase family serine protease